MCGATRNGSFHSSKKSKMKSRLGFSEDPILWYKFNTDKKKRHWHSFFSGLPRTKYTTFLLASCADCRRNWQQLPSQWGRRNPKSCMWKYFYFKRKEEIWLWGNTSKSFTPTCQRTQDVWVSLYCHCVSRNLHTNMSTCGHSGLRAI